MADIERKMSDNVLELNAYKTNTNYLALSYCVKSFNMTALHIGTPSISSSGLLKCLGYMFDKYINIYEHGKSIKPAAFYHHKKSTGKK